MQQHRHFKSKRIDIFTYKDQSHRADKYVHSIYFICIVNEQPNIKYYLIIIIYTIVCCMYVCCTT